MVSTAGVDGDDAAYRKAIEDVRSNSHSSGAGSLSYSAVRSEPPVRYHASISEYVHR